MDNQALSNAIPSPFLLSFRTIRRVRLGVRGGKKGREERRHTSTPGWDRGLISIISLFFHSQPASGPRRQKERKKKGKRRRGR